MDRPLLERLIGATILVVIVVVLAPALLDGTADTDDTALPVTAGESVGKRPGTRVVVLKTPRPADVAAIAPAAGPASPPPPPAAEQAPRSQPAVSPPPPEGFAVQLGSFAERANAERYAARVSDEGFDVFIVRAATTTLQVYRVYAGPEDSREQAGGLAERLQGKGHAVMVVELDGQRG